MSSNRRSGLSSVTAFTASKPFAHSATTSTPSASDRYSRTSLRANSSSSTIATRIQITLDDTATAARHETALVYLRRIYVHRRRRGSPAASAHSSVRNPPLVLQVLRFHTGSQRQF